MQISEINILIFLCLLHVLKPKVIYTKTVVCTVIVW